MNFSSLCIRALALVVFAAPHARAADDLPALHADPARTSVSGLSSGGFMAVQYAVAFSASTQGVGVIAGGPYNCALLSFGSVLGCMSPAPLAAPSGALSWQFAQSAEAFGQIDPVAGIARQKVYVFSGTRDTKVAPAVVAATRDFFSAAGVPAKRLAYVHTLPAGHAFIAPAFGNACAANAAPYIERCKRNGLAYDQPRAILQQLYGSLKPPATALSATVRPFDQRAFGSAFTGLDAVGFVYVPAACAAAAAGADTCAVHAVFHGCKQGAQAVGSDVYGSVGYNRWADTNRLIVLYPQVAVLAEVLGNPDGCWDWWGYTGPTFQVRSGVQLGIVKAMVERLTGTR